jgi:hypothetical protein
MDSYDTTREFYRMQDQLRRERLASFGLDVFGQPIT